MMRSYTSGRLGIRARTMEAAWLYVMHLREARQKVGVMVQSAREDCREMEQTFGFPIIGKHILDVGPGQFLIQAKYFALSNKVTAVDTDVIPSGFRLGQYFQMLRRNGPVRIAKTLGRKVLGIDREYRRALQAYLNVDKLPAVQLTLGDACAMKFADKSFDVVYTRGVIHHLPDPVAALKEIARVVKPGGGAYVAFHLYTSYNGCLDPRLLGEKSDVKLFWAHLRPKLQTSVKGNAFVNKLRLQDWRYMLSDVFPRCTIRQHTSDVPGIREAAEGLKASGELEKYSVEELVTHTVVALWTRSADTAALHSSDS